jgi:hypothetical protein
MKQLIKQTLSACAALALLSGVSFAGDPLLGGTSGAAVVADKDLAKVKGTGYYSAYYSYYGAYYAGYAQQYATYGDYYNYLGSNYTSSAANYYYAAYYDYLYASSYYYSAYYCTTHCS